MTCKLGTTDPCVEQSRKQQRSGKIDVPAYYDWEGNEIDVKITDKVRNGLDEWSVRVRMGSDRRYCTGHYPRRQEIRGKQNEHRHGSDRSERQKVSPEIARIRFQDSG